MIGFFFFPDRIVTYAAIDKSNYYTISASGVTHFSSDGTNFVSLECWEQEYLNHQRLLCIPTFALFRKRKAFRTWRNNVRYKALSACKCALQESLFVTNEVRVLFLDLKKKKKKGGASVILDLPMTSSCYE